MNNRSSIIATLIFKHLEGSLLEHERRELEEWIAASEQNALLFKKLTGKAMLEQVDSDFDNAHLQAAAEKLGHKLGFELRPRPVVAQNTGGKKYWIAAAALLLAAPVAWWLYRSNGNTHETSKEPVNARLAAISPWRNKAILTLDNGSSIVLDLANGRLSSQGTTTLYKQDGRLVYTPAPSSATAQGHYDKEGTYDVGTVSYNTITTPRGGKYQVELSDGSRVWLSAASSIVYPVTFTGAERKVRLTGEAYFEVAKNRIPFIVSLPGETEVTVLGTHFNIRSYEGEATRASLLEGKILVKKDAQTRVLRPRQQAIIGSDRELKVQALPDSLAAIAWKNNEFYFAHAGIEEVMEEISKSYNVGVQYQGDLSWFNYSGGFSRNQPVDSLLMTLRGLELDVQLKGTTIEVKSQ